MSQQSSINLAKLNVFETKHVFYCSLYAVLKHFFLLKYYNYLFNVYISRSSTN